MNACLRSAGSNRIFNVLNEKNVKRQPVAIDQVFEPPHRDGSALRHRGAAVRGVPGKGAWYLEGKAHPAGGDGVGDTLEPCGKTARQISLFLAACAA